MSENGRTRLPDRRPSVTQRVKHTLGDGKEQKVLVTFGYFSEHDTRIREIFTADFKAGSDAQTMIVEACILISRLLQHGTTPLMLLGSLSEPRSLLGSILEQAAKIEKENGVGG